MDENRPPVPPPPPQSPPPHFPEDKVEVERCTYDWIIFGFKEIFNEFNRTYGFVLESEELIRGQEVNRTSVWQIELEKYGNSLGGSLNCLRCLHDDVSEIWTRFDFDIVDMDGKVLHCEYGYFRYNTRNISRHVPKDRGRGGYSSWRMNIISMNELSQNWDRFVTRDMIRIRLHLYIYRNKPVHEAESLELMKRSPQIMIPSVINNPVISALGNLWETKENCDLEFIVEGNVIKAHEFVVSLHSQWVKELIEKGSGSLVGESAILIDDISLNTFQFLMKFLYTGDMTALMHDHAFVSDVLKLSTKMRVEELSKVCLTRLLNVLDAENFEEIAVTVFSSTPPDSCFRGEVKRFFLNTQKYFQTRESFKEFANKNPDIFVELCLQPISPARGGNDTGV